MSPDPFAPELIAPNLIRPGEVYFTDLMQGPEGEGILWKENGHTLEEGLDCKALAFVVLRRAGIPVPAHAITFQSCYADSPEVRIAEWEAYLRDASTLWEDLGTDPKLATKLGDIVVTDGPHLSTVVIEGVTPMAATISRGTRGVQVLRVGLFRDVRSVLRFRR